MIEFRNADSKWSKALDRLEQGSTFENRFEILSFLGGGGMGAVYKAKQLDANRIVALKVMHPSLIETDEFRKRFLRECKFLSQLSNDNIITFYHAAISANGFPYAVFEYMEGKTLRELLQEKGRLSVPESLRLLIQISDALAAAHAAGIIHRDLKPENIMVSQRSASSWAKVFDFGLSKSSIADERESQKLTLTGDIVGTAAYMSPEQCRGGRADARSDIYALGCISFECLSGKQLFEEATPMAALHKHLNDDPSDSINELCSFSPPALTEVIMQMLSKAPSGRPNSMNSVKESFATAETQFKQGVRSSTPLSNKQTRRSSAVPIVLGVVSLAIAASSIFGFLQYQKGLEDARKVEADRKRAQQIEIEEHNLLRGQELADLAGAALIAQDFKEAIRLAKECASLKNDSCEYIPIRMRAFEIMTQASDFSGLANSDVPLMFWGKLLKEAESRKCLSESNKYRYTFSYYILAGNVHANKNRLMQTIACSEAYEKLYQEAPEDQRKARQFLLSLVARGNALRNTRQYQKAFETDKRALALAKKLEADGADELHSVYPSVLIDCCVVNENPTKVAQLESEYAQAFEKAFNSSNSEGMMRQILSIQQYMLDRPQFAPGADPLILKGWKAAEMFPEISTALRMRALQQYLHLQIRKARSGELSSKELSNVASSYLRILEEAQKPSMGKEYLSCRRELGEELEALLLKDKQTAVAAKVKRASESFQLDGKT